MTSYAARKHRTIDRLARLYKLITHGGVDPRDGWEVREQLLIMLERLPRRDAGQWLTDHRQAREFIDAQRPN